MAISLSDSYRGALLGLAVGDALGTTLEFTEPGSFAPISDMVGGGPFNLRAGQWTDDTSMALCLAISLTETREFNTFDQMKRYCKWYKEGYLSSRPGQCFDIGITTSQALDSFLATGQPISGSADRMKAGNGSLMRLAPVPMFFRKNEAEAIDKSGVSSKTTHASPQAVDACRYFAHLLLLAFDGKQKGEICADHSNSSWWNQMPLDREVIGVAQGTFKTKQPPQIVASGYVIKTMEAALWAFYHSETFEEGALKAVNLGNDADTVGAVYGQIAGAYYGMKAIPQAWVDKLYQGSMILKLADELYTLSEQMSVALQMPLLDKEAGTFTRTDDTGRDIDL